jgi:hypothetical protein
MWRGTLEVFAFLIRIPRTVAENSRGVALCLAAFHVERVIRSPAVKTSTVLQFELEVPAKKYRLMNSPTMNGRQTFCGQAAK